MRAKAISKYALAIGAGALIGSAALAVAEVGDAVYRVEDPQVCITGPQAVCYADCALAAGAWSGARADMHEARAFRVPADVCSSGFAAVTTGTKTAPLTEVPPGSVVDGVVVE